MVVRLQEAAEVEPEPEVAVAVAEEPEAAAEEEEEEEEPKPELKLGTAPNDWRFPAQNQAKHCYTRYQEFHKCESQRGEGAEECAFFKRAFKSVCPNDWVEEWDEQREAGTFPGRY